MKRICKFSQIQEGDYLLSIEGKANAAAEAAYGIVALEMLRTESGVEDDLDEVLDCVVKSGTFEEYVCDYLGHALGASGVGGGERIYDLD